MVATGTVTVTALVPTVPSTVARIVVEPAATAVSKPPGLTVATEVLVLDHVTDRPVSAFPAASRGTADICCVCPVFTVNVAGLTVTEATGTGTTVKSTDAVRLMALTEIVAAPTLTARTLPVPSTVATAAFEVVQLRGSLGNSRPSCAAVTAALS